jgi:uncharacterized protein YjcR
MHNRGMKTHADIIKAAGSPEDVAAWRGVSVHTVRSWITRNKIPDEHWSAFAGAKHASLKELADYAAAKKSQAA